MTDISHADQAAFTIDEFCVLHRISRRTFYNLQEHGIGPRLMRLGGSKVLISVEAAAAWRAERETVAA